MSLSDKLFSHDPAEEGTDPVNMASTRPAVAQSPDRLQVVEQAISACSGVEELYSYASKIYEDNQRAIAVIDSCAEKTVSYWSYFAPLRVSDKDLEAKFELSEVQVSDKTKTLVEAWKVHIELVQLFDMFNLKTNYECSTYADLVRLNTDLFEAATRYQMFYDDESKKGRTEIAKFIRNFAAIRSSLADVTALCKDRPSRAQEAQALLEEANALLRRATRVAPLLRFADPVPPALGELGVSTDHAKLLESWIPAATSPMHPIQWKLRYQATTDGYCAADFHSRCDGVKRLLVVVKSETGFLFGGFTTEGFASRSGYVNDPTAFLFTLVNHQALPPAKMPVVNSAYAVCSHSSYGPWFGGSSQQIGQSDLFINDNCNACNTCYSTATSIYQKAPGASGSHILTRTQQWTAKDVLAFEV